MAKADLTVARLRELFHYNPEAGEFTWLVATGKRAKVGDVAGFFDKDGYVQISFSGGRRYRAHRLAWLYMTGEWPTADIDHRDGDRANNKWDNLRDATRSLNMQNQRKARRNSKSGYLGVEWNRQSGLWLARIKHDGKRLALGYFKEPEAAHEAYLAAKRRLHEGCTI